MATPSNISRSRNKSAAAENGDALAQWLERNGTLLEIFLDAYCVVDSQNRVVAFNEAFLDLTGESYRRALKIGDFCALLKTQHCPDGCPGTQVLSSGQGLRMDEIRGSSKSYPDLQMILAAVPVIDTNKTIGALITIRNVTAESELQKKYDERKKESIIDGLTQLYNKTYTEAALLRAVKTAIRQGESHKLSVVMSDIDHFKKVNDTYGHQAGDAILTKVSEVLKEEARDTDITGRFGGEEFICILGGTDTVGALNFCERFRQRVEGMKIVHDGKHIPITVSLGTATFIKPATKDADPAAVVKEMINQADTALYFAKANGRNRCCQFETLPKADAKPAAPTLKKAS